MGAPEIHRHDAPKRRLRYLIVTVSTSRYNRLKSKGRKEVDDESGDTAQEIIASKKGVVSERRLVSDDPAQLKTALRDALKKDAIDVIVFTGGTGVSSTDVTIETLRPLFEKEIEGFGELFRFVSYQKIGAAAALSRATAGIAKRKVILCLPGSPNAVKTALTMFIGEIPHILHLARGR
jgi:molybdenum cofactor biosynthesis protein B